MVKKRIIFLFFFTILIKSNVICLNYSSPEYIKFRRPIIKDYLPYFFKNESYIWSIAQDKRGIMYFANGDVIAEYDGIKWQRLNFPNISKARSIVTGSDGKVYVGAYGEIGYLAVRNGKTEYVSLMDKVPQKYRNFKLVWQAVNTMQGVFFRSHKIIFRYFKNKMHFIKANNKNEVFYTLGFVNDRVYIVVAGKGLCEIINNKVVVVNGGKQYLRLKPATYAILPFDDKKVLLITRKGYFIYDGNDIFRYYTPSDRYLIKNKVYSAIMLPDKSYAIGTKEGGVLIVDRHGKVLNIYNKRRGLRANNVRSIFVDRNDLLWIGLNEGINKVQITSRITILKSRVGIRGKVFDIKKHKGILYVSTALGVFKERINLQTGKKIFKRIRGINTEPIVLKSVDKTLLIGANQKIYQIFNGRVYSISLEGAFFDFLLPDNNKKFLLAISSRGLVLLKREKQLWKFYRKIKNVSGRLEDIVKDNFNNIWITGIKGKVYVLNFNNGYTNEPKAVVYNKNHGSLVGDNKVILISGNIYIYGKSGILKFDRKNKIFKPANLFNGFLKGKNISYIKHGPDKSFFVSVNYNTECYHIKKISANRYKFFKIPFVSKSESGFNTFYFDKNKNILWFGNLGRLILYDMSSSINHQYKILINLRSVKIKNIPVYGNDFIPYSGNGYYKKDNSGKYFINYSHNSIRFEFSSSNYSLEGRNLYRCKLEGHTDNWSAWNYDNKFLFSNLKEGNYILRVKSKDCYGNISPEIVFKFKIYPPWYRTWWSYFIYFLILVGFIIAVSTLRLRRIRNKSEKIKKERDTLDRLVKERTQELSNAYKVIKSELRMAEKIQRSMLPNDYENINNLDIKVYFNPMIEVGGDIFDVYKISDNKYRIFIADATGHGIPAALTTMIIKTEYDKIKIFPVEVNQVIEFLNNTFIKSYYSLAMFFTCCILDVDLNKKEINFASGGHPVQYLMIDDKIENLKAKGLVIGFKENVKFDLQTVKYSKNWKIILFTDGIFEETNEEEEELSEKRLYDLIKENKNNNIEKLIENLIDYCEKWRGETGRNDDITLIGIEYN